MADEFESVGATPPGSDSLSSRMPLDSAQAEEARAYLRNQNDLAILQIENLRKQDEYETSHLRWRRFNDQMKGAMQIMLVLVGALIGIGIGVTLWSAAHEDGVVIEAFSVPPDMAAKGVTGQ